MNDIWALSKQVYFIMEWGLAPGELYVFTGDQSIVDTSVALSAMRAQENSA